MSISRLYTFTPNTTILSAEVNAELNQLVNEVNLMLKKSGADSMTGDLTIAKSTPALILSGSETSAANWKFKEDTGVLYLQKDISGYVNGFQWLKLDADNSQFRIDANGGDAALTLRVNNNEANRWDILNDNSASDVLDFAYGGSSKMSLATSGLLSVAAGILSTGAGDLGTNALRFGKLHLSEEVDSVTAPTANALYANLIPKAWATTTSGAVLSAGVNLSVASSVAGIYDYTFLNAMQNATYAVLVTATGTGGMQPQVTNRSTTGFTVTMYQQLGVSPGYSIGAVATGHTVMVIGNQ